MGRNHVDRREDRLLDHVWVYALVSGASLLVALALTYAVRASARRVGLGDEPDEERHRHEVPVPRIGGVAVFVAATAITGLALLWLSRGFEVGRAYDGSFVPLFVGGAGIFALGLCHDVRRLRARTKFLVECAIAVAMFVAGIRIGTIGLPGLGTVELAGERALRWTRGSENVAFPRIARPRSPVSGRRVMAA